MSCNYNPNPPKIETGCSNIQPHNRIQSIAIDNDGKLYLNDGLIGIVKSFEENKITYEKPNGDLQVIHIIKNTENDTEKKSFIARLLDRLSGKSARI
jgi:hypothetical protein